MCVSVCWVGLSMFVDLGFCVCPCRRVCVHGSVSLYLFMFSATSLTLNFMGTAGSLTSMSHDDDSSLAWCYYISGCSILLKPSTGTPDHRQTLFHEGRRAGLLAVTPGLLYLRSDYRFTRPPAHMVCQLWSYFSNNLCYVQLQLFCSCYSSLPLLFFTSCLMI